MKIRSLFLRVATATVAMAVALVGVFQLIERPVMGETDAYTALFTDANGLRAGDDVRLYGVQVGKVTDIGLDGSLARVRFTVLREHPLFTETTIAIRFQNLTGFRYLAIEHPGEPGPRRDTGAVFDTVHTVPAFDITALFNGLQPVLAELSTDEINQLTTSLLAVIQGDGTGIGPALGAIERLSRYSSDRQAVLSRLVSNLAQIADSLGGKSGDAVQMLTNLTNLFVAIAEKLPGLADFANAIPPVIQPVRHLLTVLGLTGDEGSDLDALLRNAFPDPRVASEVFTRLPGVIQTMASAVPAATNDPIMCTNGAAVVPEPLRVLISGQGVTLCRA
ncbi:MlaD family protein [Nocardia sp. NPDC004654]|uniref:MlaD family protein n=1 Tax=Nocardia sp. NPDC004654 TaxID=3154776 RepID=UPI0033AE59E3